MRIMPYPRVQKCAQKRKREAETGSPFSLFLTPWLARYAGLPGVRTARAV